jgi:MFS family permease
MAMFAALAIGAPVGAALYVHGGFLAVAVATAAIPLLAMLLVAPLATAVLEHGAPVEFMKVAGAVWMPGLGSAFSSIGFGAMIAFSSLLAAERGWSPIWLPFSAFAVALVAARLFLGHVPDRLGGANVALVCVIIEAVGLALLWRAQGPAIGVMGAALAGFGYSLVYPGLGAEAVRRAPPQNRGVAMGGYTVFLDVALGFGSPLLGLIAGGTGPSAVFLVSAVIALCAGGIAVRLLVSPAPARQSVTRARITKENSEMMRFAAAIAALSLMMVVTVHAEGTSAKEESMMVSPALEKYRQ